MSARGTWKRTWVLAALASLALACSADAVPEPEPTLHTRGAFLAIRTDEGDLQLLRTLAVLGQGTPDELLFLGRYRERPKTYEEAKATCQRHDLQQAAEVALREGSWFKAREWRVVWFRTLTAEEESAFR